MSKKNRIIFTVGSDIDNSQDVWRVWVQGDEVYLGIRNNLNISKTSLHSGGLWKSDIGNHRFVINRGFRLSNEWYQGPGIWFPNISVNRLPVKEHHLAVSKIQNLKHAGHNEVRIIDFLFCEGKDSMINQPIPASNNIDWSQSFELRTLGMLKLISYVKPLTAKEIRYFKEEKNKIKIHFKEKLPEKEFRSNALMIENPGDGSPARYLSIPLGLENCCLS